MSTKATISQIEKDLHTLWRDYSVHPLYVNVGTVPWKKLVEFDPPLNVACPRCRALVGMKCKRKQLYPRPWGKKKPQRKAWEYQIEQLPHKERVRESKIKDVEDALDGF